MKQTLVLLAATGFLAGCGVFESDEKVPLQMADDIPPFTEDIIRTVPEGLLGDTQNARHTSETLRGNDDAGDDGKGGQ